MGSMTQNHCKTCALPRDTLVQVNEWLAKGKSGKRVSQLLAEMGITVSERAVRRHKKHIEDTTKEEPTTLLGVVEQPQDVRNVAKVSQVGNEGEANTKYYLEDEAQKLLDNHRDLLLECKIDPDKYEIIGEVGFSRWLQVSHSHGERWLIAYRFKFERIKEGKEDVDLPALFASVKSRKLGAMPMQVRSRKHAIVGFSDPQIGKTGSRGGTEELIERVLSKKPKLANYLQQQKATNSIFGDVGDLIEGFENVAAQQFTNDLSIMQQVDLGITLQAEMMDTVLENCDNVTALSVPSNHSAWRKGKDYLGDPADDWGIFAMQQIERIYGIKGMDDRVKFVYPDKHMKSVVVPVGEFRVGFAHGDEVNRPEGIPDWWAKQVHGGMPLATADVLTTGHFHTYRCQPSGRNFKGQQKWWLQCPTLDNGSDWYANKSSGDSDPGLLVYVVDEETGFDIQSVTIL